MTAHAISTETTLNVEYTPAFIPPERAASFPHDEWVSSVDVLSGASLRGRASGLEAEAEVGMGMGMVVSGAYDGLVRVWDATGRVVAVSERKGEGKGVGSWVKAVKWVDGQRVVAGGRDRENRVRIWKVKPGTLEAGGEGRTMELQVEGSGHEDTIMGLDVDKGGNKILSGSVDRKIGLWSTDLGSAPAYQGDGAKVGSEKDAKRLKRANSKSGVLPLHMAPLLMLSGHSDHVPAVRFEAKYEDVAYSASLDGTVKMWNLARSGGAGPTDTRSIGEPLLSLAGLNGLSLLAAGTTTGQIVLVDPRASAATIRVMTLRGHANMVAGLAPDPASQNRFVSGGYDGLVKVWDVRSKEKSVVSIERECMKGLKGTPAGGEGVKVFGVAWDREVGIVAGGEDKKVEIHR